VRAAGKGTQLLHWKRRATAVVGSVGVAFGDDRVDLVCVAPEAHGTALRAVATAASAPTLSDRARALAELVKQHGLRGAPGVCVLPPGACAIRLVDAPPVPPEERLEALRWSLQEAVEFAVEDAALSITAEGTAAGQVGGRLVVAVAPGSEVRAATTVLRRAGLVPRAVHAPESAFVGLAPVPDSPKGTALLELGRKQSQLAIGRSGQLVVARGLSADVDALAELPLDPAEASDDARGALETLSLEIQRSLDFFEAGFGRVPVGKLWILPGDADLDALPPALEQNLGLPVRLFDVNTQFDCADPLSLSLQARFAAALGAACLGLRDASGSGLIGSLPKPRAERVSARNVSRAAACVGALLLAYHGYERVALSQVLARRDAVEQQRAALQAQLAALAAGGRAAADPGLASRIAALRQERDARRGELRALASDGPPNADQVVGLLDALARHPLDGTWLHEIRVARGGAALALRGSSFAPDGVSLLLDALGRDPALAGVRFGALQLERNPGADRVDWSVGELAAEGAP